MAKIKQTNKQKTPTGAGYLKKAYKYVDGSTAEQLVSPNLGNMLYHVFKTHLFCEVIRADTCQISVLGAILPILSQCLCPTAVRPTVL